MNNPFNIYCEWLHTELIGQPERAAQADIIIVVNGGCITENLDIYGNPAPAIRPPVCSPSFRVVSRQLVATTLGTR